MFAYDLTRYLAIGRNWGIRDELPVIEVAEVQFLWTIEMDHVPASLV